MKKHRAASNSCLLRGVGPAEARGSSATSVSQPALCHWHTPGAAAAPHTLLCATTDISGGWRKSHRHSPRPATRLSTRAYTLTTHHVVCTLSKGQAQPWQQREMQLLLGSSHCLLPQLGQQLLLLLKADARLLGALKGVCRPGSSNDTVGQSMIHQLLWP